MLRNLIADDRETRIEVLQTAIDEFATSLANGGGKELLDRIIAMLSHVHRYSFRNLLLQQIQAPGSRLVASMAAFEEIAAEQGHEPVGLGRKSVSVRRARGAKACWILMPVIREIEEEDEGTGETETVRKCVGFRGVPTWAAEEIIYCDTGEQFEVPDHRTPIKDRDLFDELCAFAEAKGTHIDHTELFGGITGLSRGGEIVLDERDHWSLTLRTLAHEIGHELLHSDKNAPDRPDRKMREIEAETCAVAVLKYFGHHDIESSEAYLQSYGTEKRDVLASLDRIIRAAQEVVEFIAERHEREARCDHDETPPGGTQAATEAA